jgi:hypothetical protein
MLIAADNLPDTAPTTALAADLAISPPTIAELFVLPPPEYAQSKPEYTPYIACAPEVACP